MEITEQFNKKPQMEFDTSDLPDLIQNAKVTDVSVIFNSAKNLGVKVERLGTMGKGGYDGLVFRQTGEGQDLIVKIDNAANINTPSLKDYLVLTGMSAEAADQWVYKFSVNPGLRSQKFGAVNWYAAFELGSVVEPDYVKKPVSLLVDGGNVVGLTYQYIQGQPVLTKEWSATSEGQKVVARLSNIGVMIDITPGVENTIQKDDGTVDIIDLAVHEDVLERNPLYLREGEFAIKKDESDQQDTPFDHGVEKHKFKKMSVEELQDEFKLTLKRQSTPVEFSQEMLMDGQIAISSKKELEKTRLLLENLDNAYQAVKRKFGLDGVDTVVYYPKGDDIVLEFEFKKDGKGRTAVVTGFNEEDENGNVNLKIED